MSVFLEPAASRFLLSLCACRHGLCMLGLCALLRNCIWSHVSCLMIDGQRCMLYSMCVCVVGQPNRKKPSPANRLPSSIIHLRWRPAVQNEIVKKNRHSLLACSSLAIVHTSHQASSPNQCHKTPSSFSSLNHSLRDQMLLVHLPASLFFSLRRLWLVTSLMTYDFLAALILLAKVKQGRLHISVTEEKSEARISKQSSSARLTVSSDERTSTFERRSETSFAELRPRVLAVLPATLCVTDAGVRGGAAVVNEEVPGFASTSFIASRSRCTAINKTKGKQQISDAK